MKIALSAGHNVIINGIFDVGAVGNSKREADITKETVKILIPLLERQGHAVLDVTPYNEKFKDRETHHQLRCKRVDEFKADLYLDVHINAGGGTGTECWVYSNTSKAYSYADKICKSISKNLDLKNRGVKINPTYWSLKFCKAPAIIIEGAFIDNKEDMEKLTPEKYAKAIASVFGEVKEVKEVEEINNKDVSNWAKEAWNWAIKNKITDGTRPKDNATREEIITILYRFKEMIK